MSNISVISQEGLKIRDITLNPDVFGVDFHKQVVFDAIIMQQANKRQATAKTKKRFEVRGGGRKPWRQKGTGRARQGSIRSPQWRGGGIVFGPTGVQNFKLKMNKKSYKLALKSALSLKVSENNLIVVDQLKLESAKTKRMIDILKKVDAKKKTMIVIANENEAVNLSVRNIPNTICLLPNQINVYDLMNNTSLIVTEEAIKKIEDGVLNG